jgi:glutamate:GABA antiporter
MPGAWIVAVLPFAYAVIAVVFILVPGSTGKVDRLTYELTEFIPLIIIVLLTIVFYIMGHNDKRNQDVYVDLHTGESSIGRAEGVAGE